MNTLGVMTSRIKVPSSYMPYVEVAQDEGFDRTVIFTPDRVDLQKRTISGYVLENGEWVQQTVDYPTISFDIGYYHQPRANVQVRNIKNCTELPFINYGLGSKWNMHERLLKVEELQSYLIPTEYATDVSTVMKMVDEYQSVMLKPIYGKEGKGIVRISHANGNYMLEKGLTKQSFRSVRKLSQQIETILGRRRFLVQRWIPILNQNGVVFDVRALVQKNKRGKWNVRGTAVREGVKGKITSNLMDGGYPFEVVPYLANMLGKKKSRKIYRKVKQLSLIVSERMESLYERRQSQLGIDWGIDLLGNIHLIEVNIKPGVLPFKQVFGIDTKQESIRWPIQYARFFVRNRRK
ncbi:YheC/YheD family protein [Brevibacillus sp. SYSU BS000544]|uniref:YheC/YheD family endospore coat-associated protein n=1 Tax=Brevibacillus sp. SYSU BS000544 TaxID=3416443 RepID=UPI003CE54E19